MDKELSKHLNTKKFIEYFNEHIGVELIGETLVSKIYSEDEKVENKLKAVSEINKYAVIPTQAKLIGQEVDDSFCLDEREELKKLLQVARGEKMKKAKEGHEKQIERLLERSIKTNRDRALALDILQELILEESNSYGAIEYILDNELSKVYALIEEQKAELEKHKGTYTLEAEETDDYPF